jgi:hypothetical protein
LWVVYGSFFCIFYNKKKVLKKLFKELNHSQWWWLRNSVLFIFGMKNMISTDLYKWFFMEKFGTNLPNFEVKEFQIARFFYVKFHY